MAGAAPNGETEAPHYQQPLHATATLHPPDPSDASSHLPGHPEQLLRLYHQKLEPDAQLPKCEHAQPEPLVQGDSTMPTSETTQQKSSRWTISPSAQYIMEHVFTFEKFPGLATRASLARDLGATPRQIQVWFQNRRQRERTGKRNVGWEQALPPGAYTDPRGGAPGAVQCGPGGMPIMSAQATGMMPVSYNGMPAMPGTISAQPVMVIKQDGSVQQPIFGKQPCQQPPTIAYPHQPQAIGMTEHPGVMVLAAESCARGLHPYAPNQATVASPHLIAAAHLSSDATVA